MSVFNAWLALSVFADVLRFATDVFLTFVEFGGARIVLRFAPPDLAPAFLLFFFTVMRR